MFLLQAYRESPSYYDHIPPRHDRALVGCSRLEEDNRPSAAVDLIDISSLRGQGDQAKLASSGSCDGRSAAEFFASKLPKTLPRVDDACIFYRVGERLRRIAVFFTGSQSNKPGKRQR